VPAPALTPHPCPLALGKDPIVRSKAYRPLLDESLSGELLTSICLHLELRRALGHAAFRALIEAEAGRFADVGPANRPRKPIAIH